MNLKSVIIAAVGIMALSASAKEPVKSLKLLSIGNSFTWSAMTYLPKVAETAGCELIFEQASLAGCNLKRHWELAEKSDADPNFKPYEEKGVGKFSLREKLESREWDVVTIQQASYESWIAASYDPYAENLVAYIRRYAPKAEIVIQQTWSYRPGEKRLEQWNIDSDTMYRELTACYAALAERFKLRLLPAGLAVQIVRMSSIGSYPELEMIAKDNCHLSKQGQYLQACVWFSMLFNRPMSEITFDPPELSAAQSAYLRACAKAAIEVMPQHNETK
ncbi:MAG: DUF4886 domain-containing protein [Victivallaceae bacterium]|nr:DUF4886 domain-containing protein [Victivallaceae bacterium]